jgi:hypothetical protein
MSTTAWTDILYGMLDDPDWVETLIYTPFGGSPTIQQNVDCVLHRDAIVEEKNDKGIIYWYHGTLKCLGPLNGSLDPTHGGVLAPTIGDIWQANLLRGVAPLVSWMAGDPMAGNGIWNIKITYKQIVETGGKRHHGAFG